MKLRTQLLVASLVFAVAGISACSDDDSFGEGKLTSVKLVTGSPAALKMPPTDNRMQAQTAVTFVNDGKADLKVESIDFSSKPDRLLVAGAYLDESCTFNANDAPTFGDCPADSVCWSFNSTCREVGMPELPIVLEPEESYSIETIIIPGADGVVCPPAPVDDADAPNNYCGKILIKTNAQNTSEPTITDGDIRVFFTHRPGSGRIEVAPSSISFSGVNIGESDSRDLTITNIHSDQPLSIDSIRPREHAGRFEVSSAVTLPAEIGPGDSETWTLTFTPPSDWDEESFSTNLEISSTAHNDPNALIPVQVSSEASRPAIKLSPEVLRFDSDATQTITVSNEGAASLTLRGFSVVPSNVGNMYTIKEDGNVLSGQYTKVIGAGESQDYEISFAAGADPGGIGTLEVRYNYQVDGGTENDMAQAELLGDVGDAPIGMVSPDAFYFRAAAGADATRSFVIRNVGTQPLTASAADVEIRDVIPGSAEVFSSSAESGVTIAPGAMESFTVTYQGADDSAERADILFNSNTAGVPMVVSLVAEAGDEASADAVITPSFGDDTVGVNAEARFNALLSTGFSQAAMDRAQWTLLERPDASQTFIDKIGEDATIFPDTAGAYKIGLTINDGSASAQAVYQFNAQ